MLVVPYAVGLELAAQVRALTWADASLGMTWFVGYLAFNALTLTLKSAPKRRAAYRFALWTYASISAAFGLTTLSLMGPSLLWWTPLYAVLLGGATMQAYRRKDRSMASGVLTVLAACGLTLVLRFGNPAAVWTDFSPATIHAIAVTAATTGYFIGTIYHVKTLIRERNDPESARRSAAYHVFLACFVSGAAVAGWLNWGWALWSLALLVRAIAIPHSAATRSLRPMQIGLIEIFFSATVLVLVALG